MTIRMIRGEPILPGYPEYREFLQYESGKAEEDAQNIAGNAPEPWVEVRRRFEPAADRALAMLLEQPESRQRIRGAVMDLGAGTCWLSAEVSKVEGVQEVFCVDLSPRFLEETGTRVMRHLGAELDKVTLVASDFSRLPLPDQSLDCVFLFAAIHHSLAPLRTLYEARRCLRPGGTLFVLEGPPGLLHLRRARVNALAETRRSGCTEFTYSRGELEYLFAHGGFAQIARWNVPSPSRSPLRTATRSALRALQLEHIVLSGASYVWTLERPHLDAAVGGA